MRLYFFLIILIVSSFAKEVGVEYKASFGFFGTIGDVTGKFLENSTTYSIERNATATGLARILSNGRYERHYSSGSVKDGLLKPDEYIQEIETGSSYEKNTFEFMHDQKKVLKHHIKRTWNLNNETLIDKNETKNVDYYADNDLLSLFFNLPYALKKLEHSSQTRLYAVGANKKDGGVDIYIPKNDQLESAKELLETESDKIVIAILNQKIFGSEKGELVIALDEESYAKKAVLKDVVFFGDIRGEMINKEEKE
ncbi:MAG: DUF3108 domain-containing protein [Campylobacterales bacterium]